MHSRNPYSISPPNFAQLAVADKEFAPFIKLNAKRLPTIDFQDPNALRALTRALMRRDFGIELELPQDRLCPAIPGRIDYILWIQDLLQVIRDQESLIEGDEEDAEIVGLDVGTGATAIYPLLGCRLQSNLQMVATECDDASYQCACRNVEVANLQNRVQCVKTNKDGRIFDNQIFEVCDEIDFTLCNPPFYSSDEEIALLSKFKENDPFGASTGAPSEMVAEGGEVGFVGQMIQESEHRGQSIRWFTSLLGKRNSISPLIAQLKSSQCDNYIVTELLQGQTKRWVLAWSWQATRLPDAFTRVSLDMTRYQSHPNTLRWTAPLGSDLIELRESLTTELLDIDLTNMTTRNDSMIITAHHISWSRQARRAKARGELPVINSNEPCLVCSVKLSVEPMLQNATQSIEPTNRLEVCWIRGKERLILESFFSHLVRKLASAAKTNMDAMREDSRTPTMEKQDTMIPTSDMEKMQLTNP